MNVTLELEVNDGLELPLNQSQLLIKSGGEKIILSKVHLVSRKLTGEVRIGKLVCNSDSGDRAECDLHIVSMVERKGREHTASAAIRLIIKAGSNDAELYAWSAGPP